MRDFFTSYCERTLPGFWEEPLNAITNLAFILSGVLMVRLYRKQPALTLRNSWDFVLLNGLLFTIGIGSGLWHTMPNKWTELSDVIPILLFINVYLLSFLYRVALCRVLGLVALFLMFHALNFLIAKSFPLDYLNGSIFYAPAWLTLLAMGIYLITVKYKIARYYILAISLFTVSLFFRTIDLEICQWVPIGTHFIWHILNAWLLYLLASVLIKQEANKLTGYLR